MGKLKFLEEHKEKLYVGFRVVVGLLFFMHGWGKFTGEQAPTGMFLVAGIMELAIGAGLVLGMFTRLAAVGGAVTMLVAFFKVHVMGSGTLNPLVNKGELALIFFLAFLVVMAWGNGKLSLERKLLGKEMF